MKIQKKVVLEFIGEFLATFVFATLVFIGPMLTGSLYPFMLAFAIIAIWYTFSPVARTHMNPVVTFGEYIVVLVRQLVNRKFYVADLLKFFGLITTQFLAFLAAFPLAVWIRSFVITLSVKSSDTIANRDSALGQLQFSNTYTDASYAQVAFFFEFFIAMLLVFAALRMGTSEKLKSKLGLIWASLVFAMVFVTFQLYSASFNPWRSLVPALLDGNGAQTEAGKTVLETQSKKAKEQLGTYLLAPAAGALVAAGVHMGMQWLSGGTTATVVTSSVKKTEEKKGGKK
jgi:glycerol uptake facilitator-like aquaporin